MSTPGPGCQARGELAFRLDATQTGVAEPDLDNLVKSTIDALDGPSVP